jgi:fermentation-respiration switch protein FrsA (DUF1100 family)
LVLVLGPGCISLDPYWFNPVDIDEYLAWQDAESIVPVENVEWLTLESAPVEDQGETEATVLYGVWLHQCTTANPNSCLPTEFPWRQTQTILYLHGNGKNLDGYWDRFEILFRLGYSIFAVDYRGYGRSEGTPTEAGLYNDARAALEHTVRRVAVTRDPDVDLSNPPSPRVLDIIYYGFSLGTVAAVQIATEVSGAAVLHEAANAGSQAFLDDGIALGLDNSVFMDTEFDNLGKIGFVLSPQLFMHGTEDDFVRYEFAEQLHERARDPKQLFPVEGGLHGNVPCPTNERPNREEGNPCTGSDAYKDVVTGFTDEWVGGPE